jgi:hypothetical protein
MRLCVAQPLEVCEAVKVLLVLEQGEALRLAVPQAVALGQGEGERVLLTQPLALELSVLLRDCVTLGVCEALTLGERLCVPLGVKLPVALLQAEGLLLRLALPQKVPLALSVGSARASGSA